MSSNTSGIYIGIKTEIKTTVQPIQPKETSLVKTWLNLISRNSSETIQKEFQTIKQFVDKNSSAVNIIKLSPTDKIKINHTKPSPYLPEIPEKYTVMQIKTINGKDTLVSTITYEIYPDKDNPKNYRIVKLTMKERKSKIGEFPQVDVIKQAVDIKEDKTFVINLEEEAEKIENTLLDILFPDKSKAVTRRKAKRKLKNKISDMAKTDPVVRYLGYPMRNSMALKLKKIKEKINGTGYEILVTCTMGGKHSSWTHGTGYAVDFVIYKEVDGKRKYLRKGHTGMKDGKKVNMSEAFEEEMKKISEDKKLDLFVYNEYTHKSTYKTGDHFHINVVNPPAVKAVAKELNAETGAKSAVGYSEEAIMEEMNIILNGILPLP